MKKKFSYLVIISLGMVVLSACGTNDEQEGASTEATQSESVVSESTVSESIASESTASQAEESVTEEVSLQEKYNKVYTDGLAQYDAGKYDEAAGTIGLLLQNDLSEYNEIKTKAVSLEEKITLAQAEEAKADEATAVIEKSTYKTERTSDLASSEFTEATGKDIKTVPDDEISTWISDKEAAVEETLKETTKATPEEEMTEVLNQVVAISGISAEDNQFYATKTDEQTYTVEIRHSHEVDGVGISNMVGMFKYDLTTKELKKMDPLTGEYSVFNGTDF
ncbi:hypothetical protein [Carnobacterium sp. ISL-102]|uniref:hypothetical protein n=1 Tax=Carnobacterium sp. ISL-102 TaxID=2819142 RepID=UPI001BE962F3|nr:hypothetical protein [Carnobacterium sp. ISL-102]MBT2732336.1 hypothetical protein [Carnobacterium sp. ISL-102]